VSYAAAKAEHESLSMQWLAEAAGLGPEGSRKAWRTKDGSSLVAPGIGGPLTGYGIDGILVVDDPHKDRRDVESSVLRQHVIDWFRAVAMTRLHPSASVIIVQTRWHPADLYGHQAEQGWQAINLPAIDDSGAALWPELRDAAFLEDIRAEIGEYEWASLYQGSPRPRGGTVFAEPHYYDRLPDRGYSIGHGCDLAYTAKTHADYSVVISALARDGHIYVADVVRKQVDAPSFTLTLKAQQSKYPAGRMVWHASGTEKGSGQFIRRQLGPRFEVKTASADKFVRAQPVAAAWNAGKVLLPREAPWLDTFLSEVCAFTGVSDLHDDQVDALASAFTALEKQRSGYRDIRKRGGPKRCM
jgi:predicted phage terminase large subunit-like protein